MRASLEAMGIGRSSCHPLCLPRLIGQEQTLTLALSSIITMRFRERYRPGNSRQVLVVPANRVRQRSDPQALVWTIAACRVSSDHHERCNGKADARRAHAHGALGAADR